MLNEAINEYARSLILKIIVASIVLIGFGILVGVGSVYAFNWFKSHEITIEISK